MMDETTRDPALAAALRELQGEPPAVDWDGLRARVTAQAELPLARRRRSLVFRRGLRTVLPLAAAAGIAAVALTGFPGAGAERALAPEEEAVVEEILTLSVPDQVSLLMTGEAAEAAMLEKLGTRE